MAHEVNTWTLDVLYDVHVTADRLVFARTGGQFDAETGPVLAAVLGSHFGVLGVLIGRWFVQRAAKKATIPKAVRRSREATAHLSLDQLARAHKKSFQIFLHELEDVEIRAADVNASGPAVAALLYRRRGERRKTVRLPNEDAARTCIAALRQVLGARLGVESELGSLTSAVYG